MIDSTGPRARSRMFQSFGRALLPLCAVALTACGGAAVEPEGGQAAGAAPSKSPGGAAGQPAAPTLPPGPGGLTPVFSHGPREGARTVALSFDAAMAADQSARAAGGERFDNPALTDTLRRMKVPATFFLTERWTREYAEQAGSIGRDPLFEAAVHAGERPAASPCQEKRPAADLRKEVERTVTAIRRAGAQRQMPYVRFPETCFDERTLKAVAPTRMTAVRWDVPGGDAGATDARKAADRVVAQVRPGSVVDLRSSLSTAPVTDEVVARIVPELRAKGYRFVRVSELVAAEQEAARTRPAKPSAAKPSAENPRAEKPGAEKPGAAEPSAAKQEAARPGGGAPSADEPARPSAAAPSRSAAPSASAAASASSAASKASPAGSAAPRKAGGSWMPVPNP